MNWLSRAGLVVLCAVIPAGLGLSGCKSFSPPRLGLPKLAAPKNPFARFAGKKDSPAAPPSRVFEDRAEAEDETQVAIEEPDINTVASLDTRPPSADRSPTRPPPADSPANDLNRNPSSAGIASKSSPLAPKLNASTEEYPGGFGYPPDAGSLAGRPRDPAAGTAATPQQPLRKPYEMASNAASTANDRLKDAAADLSRDINRFSTNNGQELKAAADAGLRGLDSATQEADRLVQSMVGGAGGSPGPTAPATGNQFQLPKATEMAIAGKVDQSSPKMPFTMPPVEPFSGLSPGTNPSAPPQTAANLQTPATSQSGGFSFTSPSSPPASAPSGAMALVNREQVAIPPAPSAANGSRFQSGMEAATSPASTPNVATLSPRSASPPPAAGSGGFPSTGYASYVASEPSPNAGPKFSPPASLSGGSGSLPAVSSSTPAPALPTGSAMGSASPVASGGAVNGAWQTSPNPAPGLAGSGNSITADSSGLKGPIASPGQGTVSQSGPGLPSSLLQRSGSYAPGSTRTAAGSNQTPWK